MIKVVIFDIGGVTVKSSMPFVYRTVGSKFGLDAIKVERTFENICPLAETGKFSPQELWSELAKKLEIKNVKALKNIWLDSFRKHAVINKNVVRIIKRVNNNGYKVVTLSNTMEPHEKLHIKKGHYKFFDRVFLSNRLGIRKPDIKIYRRVAKKLKVKTSECIFIDDKIRNVIGARKAGMKGVWFRGVAKLEKDLKKYL